MNRGVALWQDMLVLVGVLGRGFGFDGVQGRCLQTIGNRRDNGVVMKEVLKGVVSFVGVCFERRDGLQKTKRIMQVQKIQLKWI